MKTLYKPLISGFFIFILFFVIWHFLVIFNIIKPFIAPSPVAIFRTLIEDRGLIFSNALITFGVTILGLGISLIASIILAVFMSRYITIHNIVYPFVLMLQVIPILVFAPILVLWFGYGITTQLVMVILMCFFPMLLLLLRGFQSVSQEQFALMKSMGASAWHIFYWIKFPNAIFSLFSGMRITVLYAVTASIISEWVSAVKGLGVVMIASQKSFAVDRVFAINFVVILMSLLLYIGVVFFEYVLMPWKRINNK